MNCLAPPRSLRPRKNFCPAKIAAVVVLLSPRLRSDWGAISKHAVGWLLGQFLDVFPKGPPRALALLTHMTLGGCVMVFLVARLIWRFVNPPPPVEPTQFGRSLEIASRVSHW